MIEKWKVCIDNGGLCGALLTDLSKAFDCLSHDLLLAKLHAYGIDINSLKILCSYLKNRKQRVRIGNIYSLWHDILTGVPQGSILGPLLFNIYLCDLFLFLKGSDIANYADDNTPFSCQNDPKNVITELEHASSTLLTWCLNNGMKANPDKYHFLHTANDDVLTVKVGQLEIKNSEKEKLLGVTIDNKLTFEPHIKNLCNKVSQKLNTLARGVSHYINFEQRRTIMKAFITSQFGYCPLVWMFHTRKSNNRINRLHERSLRLTYNDYESSFQELLVKDKSVCIHHINLQVLATLLSKVINNLTPEIIKEIFPIRPESRYNLRSVSNFQTRNVRTVRYGTETLSFLATKIWALVPDDVKNASSIEVFKEKIKACNFDNCPCRICKTYIQNLGFI